MKVLWITNTLFPDVCRELGINIPVVEGWLYAGAKALMNDNDKIELAVASLYNGKEDKTLYLNGIYYFLSPKKNLNGKYDAKLETHWKSIQNQFQPDIIHIHGTESPHGLAYVRACGKKNVVVSIQGLVSICERYYYGGITRLNLLKNTTIRDFVRLDTVFDQHTNMYNRGDWEKKMIQSVDHVIGRTLWDKVHLWAINPTANYHFCNETLRNEFYQHKWELDNCKEHSIFLSQAHYPLKGIHKVIEALPLIVRHFPDTKLYVAGNDFVTNRGWKLNGFGKYISSLIKKNGLTNKVIFTGSLSEESMCQQYLSSHVFVCPSSIENSSNSVGEAQLLGVPCVASCVGGMTDLIAHNETGLLYRFEETEMLANAVCEVFSNDILAKRLSEKGREVAISRHNSQKNAQQLISIYENIDGI
ncbi:MAG: glycosyltransferase family 4 protein [Paludibacter sp.]|nr:glycosyltransferase family 4 protein [Paludibacter sp.]